MFGKNIIRNKKINWILVGVIGLFLFLQLQVYDLAVGWRDNGFLLYASERILEGEVPYRDFFLTTTPGTYYLRAITMKLFGYDLIIGRILYIVFAVGIIILSSRLFETRNIYYLLSMIVIILILYAPGGFGFYNTQTIFLTLAGVNVIKSIIENRSTRSAFYLGVIAAVIFLFKQSIGIFLLIAFVLTFIMLKRYLTIRLAYLFAGLLIPIILSLYYYHYNSALDEFIHQTFVFAGQVKTGASLKVIMLSIFLPLTASLYYLKLKSNKTLLINLSLLSTLIATIVFIFLPIRIQQRLVTNVLEIPFIVGIIFLVTNVYVLLSTFSRTDLFSKKIRTYSIISVFIFFGYGISGYGNGILSNTYFLFLPLMLLYTKFLNTNNSNLVKYFFLFFLFYGTVISVPKFFPYYKVYAEYPKNTLTESLNIERADRIKISADHKKDINDLLSLIENNTQEGDTIICFPYCPMLYYLSDRKAPTYHYFYYQETFRVDDQYRHINQLESNPPKIVVIQKTGTIDDESGYEDERLIQVKKYLSTLHPLMHESENFQVYY